MSIRKGPLGQWASLLLLIAAAALATIVPQDGHAAAATARASATKSVEIDDFAFQPKTLRVKRGDRITFANRDGTTHTATSAGFDRRLAPGAAATVRFGQKGTFAYHCKIHPFMKGKVVVE